MAAKREALVAMLAVLATAMRRDASRTEEEAANTRKMEVA
jgi:hypothetical protein